MLVISRAMTHFSRPTTAVYWRKTKDAGVTLEVCFYRPVKGWIIRVVDDRKKGRRVILIDRCDTPSEITTHYLNINGDIFERKAK